MNEITYEIEHSPSYASLRLDLQPEETVIVEARAMAAMDSCIQFLHPFRPVEAKTD